MAAAVALLWPSRIVGPLDGVPLDQPSDAVVIGLLIPALWWLGRDVFASTGVRTTIVLLLLWKAVTSVVLQQHGLCASTYAAAAWSGTTQTIRVAEPSGALRSWDVRSDWRASTPRCTAILTRSLNEARDFPAWFVNITDQMMGRRDFTMTIRGYVTLDRPQVLQWGIEPATEGGGPATLRLDPGTQPISSTVHLAGEHWRFAPTLDGTPLWNGPLVTVQAPRAIDRWVAPWGVLVTPLLVIALIAGMLANIRRTLRLDARVVIWSLGAAVLAAAMAMSPSEMAWRAAGMIGLGAALIPIRTPLRNMRGAFLMVGVPWLVFFGVWSRGQIGRFSIYSYDDWLAYQVAGYRIFMNGYWLEAGTLTFDYQPLYRWVTGLLHLAFGDSSVGELYLDAASLLVGALLAFYLVKVRAGFRWAVVASGTVLATFTVGTPWHFIGRGLSEITAAGLSFLAVFFLLRGRRGSGSWIAAATLMAVLMFYARLNHLLWAPFLAAFLLPLRTAAVPSAVAAGIRRVRVWRAVSYASGFAIGVLLVALRTWHYTGVFSLFYGTSLRHNDTGLRPWTFLNRTVWAKVGHSLASFVTLTEPPRPDPRSGVMAAGVLAWLASVLQRPVARGIPASVVIASAGAALGALFAHAHPYPGRFSIHAVPFATALAFLAARALVRRPAPAASIQPAM
jgi:hypothetical protein